MSGELELLPNTRQVRDFYCHARQSTTQRWRDHSFEADRPKILSENSMTKRIQVEYAHKYEYRWLDENGNWSEPEIRYHNTTPYKESAIRRHRECKDYSFEDGPFLVLDHKVYGYSGKNCTLVKRTTITEVVEKELGEEE